MKDYSFQGYISLGNRRAGGKPGVLTEVGDAPTCKVSLKTDQDIRKESMTGLRQQSAVLDKGQEADLELTLNYFDDYQLALGLYAKVAEKTAGTVTAEPLPSGLVVGDTVLLDKPGVSNLVLTDSTGTPVTLTLGTHYTVDAKNNRKVTIKSLAGVTQPFSAAYSYAGAKVVSMFTTPSPERYFYLDGINTVDQSPVEVHLYRCKFQPADTLDLINDSFGQLNLKAKVLYDPEAAVDPDLGGFGKIEMREAA